MENQGIIVHLGAEDAIRDKCREEYQELEKNIGKDKTGLVKDIFDYMMMTREDELNPEGYTPAQINTAKIIRKAYDEDGRGTSGFRYKTDTGGFAWMYFDKKLSSYLDAFHTEDGSVEFGNLEETIEQEHVYLIAETTPIGGRRK